MDNGDKLAQRFLQYHRPYGFAYLTDMEKSTVEAPLDYSIAKYELTDVGDSRTLLKVAIVYKSSTRLLALLCDELSILHYNEILREPQR